MIKTHIDSYSHLLLSNKTITAFCIDQWVFYGPEEPTLTSAYGLACPLKNNMQLLLIKQAI
jgi:hypothetical protein